MELSQQCQQGWRAERSTSTFHILESAHRAKDNFIKDITFWAVIFFPLCTELTEETVLFTCEFFFLRLRQFHLHQALQPLSQRKGLLLQTDGFWLWSCQERVTIHSFLTLPSCMTISPFILIFYFVSLPVTRTCSLPTFPPHLSEQHTSHWCPGVALYCTYWVQRWIQSGLLLMLAERTALFIWQTQGPRGYISWHWKM